MAYKTKWKHYMFVPEGAPPGTKGICFGDEGFMELMQEWYDGRNLTGYRVHDTRFKPGMGGRCGGTDWKGFKEALWKHQAKHPRKPSVFWCDGRYGDTKHEYLRRQMLWSVMRAYSSPGDLAMDILQLLATGPEDEFFSFTESVRCRKAMVVFLTPPWKIPAKAWSYSI